MTVSIHFILHAVERMASVAPVTYRRIFNGYGIYHHGVQFAIIINDQLYFRADNFSRDLYLAKKMSAFQPCPLVALESSFFQLPDDVLNHPPELIYWMRIAVEAAQNAYSIDDDESLTNTPVRHMHNR
jgi:DNA transformation protein and related proteins